MHYDNAHEKVSQPLQHNAISMKISAESIILQYVHFSGAIQSSKAISLMETSVTAGRIITWNVKHHQDWISFSWDPVGPVPLAHCLTLHNSVSYSSTWGVRFSFRNTIILIYPYLYGVLEKRILYTVDELVLAKVLNCLILKLYFTKPLVVMIVLHLESSVDFLWI